jgi:WD40 repeat protein
MSHDVFISFSSKDKNAGDAVCAILERNGIRCWIAPRDVTPGMTWGGEIVSAIHGAKVMVLVFSGAANTSPQIEREVERAISKGIPVIPFRIEDVQPSDSLEYFISASHWLDAFSEPLEQHLEKLAQVVKRIVEVRGTDGNKVNPSNHAPPPRTAPTAPPANVAISNPRAAAVLFPQRRWVIGAGGAAVVALGAGGFALWSRQTAESNGTNAGSDDAAAWSLAESVPMLASWRSYLKAWPKGRHADEARQLIKARENAKRLVRTFVGPSGWIIPIFYLADGKQILSAGSDMTPKLWNTSSGAIVRSFIGHTGRLRALAVSPDERWFASAGASKEDGDGSLRIWNLATGKEQSKFFPMPGWTYSIAWSPDAKTLATTHDEGTLQLRDAWDLSSVRELKGHLRKIWHAAFSPDGRSLVSGSVDTTARVWDVKTGELRYVLTHNDAVGAVAFSPNGRLVITSSGNEIKFWDAVSGREARTLSCPQATSDFALSDRGRFLVSGGAGGAAELWNLDSGQSVQSFHHDGDIWGVAFAPDGMSVLTTGRDGVIRLWDVSDLTAEDARRVHELTLQRAHGVG